MFLLSPAFHLTFFLVLLGLGDGGEWSHRKFGSASLLPTVPATEQHGLCMAGRMASCVELLHMVDVGILFVSFMYY